jgi:hypothetical protein
VNPGQELAETRGSRLGCELAFALATKARRAALLTALHRMAPILTLSRLDVLLRGRHAEDFEEITVEDLTKAQQVTVLLDRSESTEDAVMRVFQIRPAEWFSSGFFIRHMGLERWTAQALLAELADRGLLERKGKTAGTRYRLAARLTDWRRQPAEVSNDDA